MSIRRTPAPFEGDSLYRLFCCCRSNVARVPHLVAPRVRTKMSFCRKFTTVMLLGSMGVAGVSIYDDYLIFEQCSKWVTTLCYTTFSCLWIWPIWVVVAIYGVQNSWTDRKELVSMNNNSGLFRDSQCKIRGCCLRRRAMEKATTDTRLKDILGEHIQQGPWYEATMGVDHEGHSASCSFPVTGSLGSANLHLRAVRYEGMFQLTCQRVDTWYDAQNSLYRQLSIVILLEHCKALFLLRRFTFTVGWNLDRVVAAEDGFRDRKFLCNMESHWSNIRWIQLSIQSL